MGTYKIIFWVGLVAEILIRAPYNKQRQKETKSESKSGRQEKILLSLLSLTFLTPLIYSTTHWFDFADYSLPAWAGPLGAVFMLAALIIFWRGHFDLGANWSPTLDIRTGHKLITNGIYGYIRHPMYASQWIWVFAQAMLLQNWIAGFLGIPIWFLFYFLRVAAEEKMMSDTFGDEYREYMSRTGAVFPRLK